MSSTGFQCQECYGTFPSMWGNICNACRAIESRHGVNMRALITKDILATQNKIMLTALISIGNSGHLSKQDIINFALKAIGEL